MPQSRSASGFPNRGYQGSLSLKRIVGEVAPDIVFHLAAQPIVRESYADPITTFATNILGTVHVLEAARATPSVRALVSVTTDKVYESNSSDNGALLDEKWR